MFLRGFSAVCVGFVILTGQVFGLDYSAAPASFLGYNFGAPLSDTQASLQKAGTPFQTNTRRQAQGYTTITLENQTVDQLSSANVQLTFFREALVEISLTVSANADNLKKLRDVLNAKYGEVRSVDGGYHFNWFFTQGSPASAHQPDFAIVLFSDPVTAKKIELTYVDNARRANTSLSETTPGMATSLDPGKF